MNIAIWIFTVIATFCFMEFIAWFSHKYIMHGFMWFLHKDHHKKDHKSWFERNDMFFLQYAAISNIDNKYARGLRRAHKIHHKHLGKKDGECFGMLVVPKKYFK